ncbi:Protein of unknown function [Pyronema omphalodes CBS 100304]|uniref:Uncharacterized protein n=1 Tax=Pyronema omphalodes (strain CBS 100304) TaxID=1076935 RepID=U4L8N7_PYROM|nr:Protein of unknown function [Pyronema omphalodes CBS 100304]
MAEHMYWLSHLFNPFFIATLALHEVALDFWWIWIFAFTDQNQLAIKILRYKTIINIFVGFGFAFLAYLYKEHGEPGLSKSL